MKREVENKLLVLKLISLVHKINLPKLSHMVFILQQEGRKEQKRTFNYEFVKWNIEAYCPELERDVEHLLIEKLIVNEQGVRITAKGKALLEQQERFFKLHKIKSFFHFYLYIYEDFPLYQLTDTLFKRYELAKYQDKELITEQVEQVDLRQKMKQKEQLEEARRKVQKTYEELEKKDAAYMKEIQRVMGLLKNDEEEKRNAE